VIAARVGLSLAVIAAFSIPAVVLAPAELSERARATAPALPLAVDVPAPCGSACETALPPAVQRVLAAARPAVTACFRGVLGHELLVRMTGATAIVAVSGGDDAVEQCAAHALRRLRGALPEGLPAVVLVTWDGTLALHARIAEPRPTSSDGFGDVRIAIERCVAGAGELALVVRLLVDSDGRAIGSRPFDGTDPGQAGRCIAKALAAGKYQPSDAIVDHLIAVRRRAGVTSVTARERRRDPITPRDAYLQTSATILRWEYAPGAVGSRTPATNPY
jgi:hypothetical protein